MTRFPTPVSLDKCLAALIALRRVHARKDGDAPGFQASPELPGQVASCLVELYHFSLPPRPGSK